MSFLQLVSQSDTFLLVCLHFHAQLIQVRHLAITFQFHQFCVHVLQPFVLKFIDLSLQVVNETLPDHRLLLAREILSRIQHTRVISLVEDMALDEFIPLLDFLL